MIIYKLNIVSFSHHIPRPKKVRDMADKPEMDLDLKSDCAWVRALDADGNSIRIEKSVLVELIRANMPVATKASSGLMSDSDRRKFPSGIERSGTYKSMKIAELSKWSCGVLIITEASGEGKTGGFGLLFIDGRNSGNTVSFTYVTIGSTHSASAVGYVSTPLYYNRSGDLYNLYIKDIQIADPVGLSILNLSGNIDVLYEESTIPADAIFINQQRFVTQ